MRTRKLAAALLAATTAGLAGTQAVHAGGPGGTPFRVTLTGAQEVPPGDPDGRGTAVLRLNQGQGKVCVTFRLQGIDTPTAAHIHRAPRGAAGPVVVPLDLGGGCTRASKAQIKAIRKHPREYYVNVHNAAFPRGALRGQLR